MTNVLRIPDKFDSIGVMSGIDFEVDTKGLMCEICPRGGSIVVFLKGKSGMITVKADEKFSFCGKIWFNSASETSSVDCFYYHTL